MIPKVIHYCWFGNNEKSKIIKDCIDSWKKNCPDYEIIEWNESNFDINCNKYVKQAYESQKWAFVSDYARLWILYNYGGIYLDTDVKLIKSLDEVLDCKLFFASEDNVLINTGLGCGSVKGNTIIKKMLNDYNDISFINSDGSYDMTTCVIRNSKSIETYLNKIDDMKNKYTCDLFTYYSSEYFCPYNNITRKTNITKNSIGIHLFNGSWKSSKEKCRDYFLVSVKKIIGNDLYNKIKKNRKKDSHE